MQVLVVSKWHYSSNSLVTEVTVLRRKPAAVITSEISVLTATKISVFFWSKPQSWQNLQWHSPYRTATMHQLQQSPSPTKSNKTQATLHIRTDRHRRTEADVPPPRPLPPSFRGSRTFPPPPTPSDAHPFKPRIHLRETPKGGGGKEESMTCACARALLLLWLVDK